MTAHLHIKQLEAAKRAKQIVWILIALIISTITWAAFATLEEVVVGQGQVVPSVAVHPLQSLDGGILKSILVKEGQQVNAGDKLLEIDALRFASAFDEAKISTQALKRQLIRLDAEINSVIIHPETEAWLEQIKLVPQTILMANGQPHLQSQAIYLARLAQLRTQLDQANSLVEQKIQAKEEAQINARSIASHLTLLRDEIKMTQGALQEGAVARIELLKLEREEIQKQGDMKAIQAGIRQLKAALNQTISERRTLALDFINRAQAERNEINDKLAGLTESIKTLADRLDRTQMLAPISGSIANITIGSLGEVIEPGQTIMEIVPQTGGLIVESKVAPQDIGFVRKGLNATVKFTAYDFVIYGGLNGEVTYISPDAQQLEDGTTYYEVHVKTTHNQLNGWPIIAGMQTSTDILTGEKTVLNYWLKPLLRARATALREP